MLRNTTLFAFLGFSLLYFTSYSSGPTARAGDVTGSPLSTQQCGGCHNGGNFNPSTTISLLDQGAAVTAYEPGKTYTLQVSVAAENGPSGYGFQAVVLDESNNNAGTFGSPAADFRVATRSMREYVEHTNTQTSSVLEIDWTAPDAGTGEISVFAAGNAVNSSSSTSGDNVATGSLTLPESGPSSIGELADQAGFDVFQTAPHTLQIELGTGLSLPAHYSLHDLSGRVVQGAVITSAETTVELASGAPQVLVMVVRDQVGKGDAKRVLIH